MRLLSAPRANEQQTVRRMARPRLAGVCCTFLRRQSSSPQPNDPCPPLHPWPRLVATGPANPPAAAAAALSALGIVEPERQAPRLTTAIAPLYRCHRETIEFLAALYSDQCLSCSTPRGYRLALDTHPNIAVAACMDIRRSTMRVQRALSCQQPHHRCPSLSRRPIALTLHQNSPRGVS